MRLEDSKQEIDSRFAAITQTIKALEQRVKKVEDQIRDTLTRLNQWGWWRTGR